MSRSPRKCIFCGSNANSREHIWPTWLHELFGPPAKNARHNRQLHNFHPKTGKTVTGPSNRQGDLRTIRIRAVCSDCNNGWMNRLETDVRPYLTPIVQGSKATLGPDAIGTLARWITLKVMVAEHDAPDLALTPQADREAFWQTGKIPDYFNLYVAHNVSKMRQFYVRHSHCVAYSPEGLIPPLNGTFKNVQYVTLVAGEAIIQAVCTRIDGIAIEERAFIAGFHDRCRIWPITGNEIDFPRRPRLDAEGIGKVASVFERYITNSRAIWVD